MPLRLRRPHLTSLFGALIACVALVDAAAQRQQPPTFRSGVEVVRIDVSVVDKTGHPVGDLKPEDFTVTVDGKPRAIVSAQFLEYEARTVTTPVARGAAAPVRAPASVLQAPPPPRIVLIVIDEDSIEPVEGLAVRQAVTKFLDRLAPNDRVGVVTIPRLRSEVTLSTRRADVLKSLESVLTGVTVDRYDYSVGLAEAFAIERGEADVAKRVVERECGNMPDCPPLVMMQVRQMALQAHLRGQRSLDALAGLAEGLAGVEGPKTVLLVSGGMPMPELHVLAPFDKIEATFAAAQVSLYTLFMERSTFGQVRNKPSPTALEDDVVESYGLQNTTSVTGGTLMPAIGTLDQYFDRVVTELSGSYLLGIEVAPADRDGRTHQVDVKVNRSGVEVRARKRYLIEAPRPAPAAPTAAKDARGKADKPAKGARDAAPATLAEQTLTPEVEAAIDRAGTYAAAYETDLSGLVAEEKYVQQSLHYEKLAVTYSGPPGRATRVPEQGGEWTQDAERTLRSDFLLVKAQGGDRWMPFRDVFEVDGKAVREREQRLQKLFLEAPATASERAAQINAESARFNIGFVERNVNLPTLALRLLDPARRARLIFRKQGEAKVSGVRTWELAFAERGSPSLVRDGDKDLPATGSFWIDPATGRVIRSRMELKIGSVSIEVTVTYRPDARAGGTWVPAEMREMYMSAARRVECVATYSNIRRFQVTTDEVQK